LIAYFIGNICAKKYQHPFTYVKVIQAKGATFFETHCICAMGQTHNGLSAEQPSIGLLISKVRYGAYLPTT